MVPEEFEAIINEQLRCYEHHLEISDVGTVIQVADGICRVYGLEKAVQGELLEFPDGVYGMAMNLEEDHVGAALLGEASGIR